LRFGGLPNVIVGGQVWPHRYVVPGHEPESRHVDRHVVVPQPALVPRRVVRLALDHRAARIHWHRVGEDSARPIHSLYDVHDRKTPQRLRPIHRRHLGRQIEHPRRSNQVLLRCVRRKHRTRLVLLPVNPGGEQQLDGAAAVPVPLLVIRSHASHSGAESLRDHRRKRRIAERRDRQLPFGGRGAPDHPYLAVRPGLFGYPREGVIAVTERRAQDVVVPLGEEMTALVHLDEGVSALDCVKLVAHIARRAVANVPEIEVIWRPHEDRGVFLRRVFRAIDVRSHALAIAHLYHELPLDDRHGLQLLLDRVPPGDLFRVGAASPLSGSDLNGDYESRSGKYQSQKNLLSHAHAPWEKTPTARVGFEAHLPAFGERRDTWKAMEHAEQTEKIPSVPLISACSAFYYRSKGAAADRRVFSRLVRRHD